MPQNEDGRKKQKEVNRPAANIQNAESYDPGQGQDDRQGVQHDGFLQVRQQKGMFRGTRHSVGGARLPQATIVSEFTIDRCTTTK